jgi:hypothetical protein
MFLDIRHLHDRCIINSNSISNNNNTITSPHHLSPINCPTHQILTITQSPPCPGYPDIPSAANAPSVSR